jgi:hypothetical protein
VQVQSNAVQQRFLVDWTGGSGVERLVNLDDPFQTNTNTDTDTLGLDRRVGILTDVCRDLIDGSAPSYPWYRQSIRLWDMAERLC